MTGVGAVTGFSVAATAGVGLCSGTSFAGRRPGAGLRVSATSTGCTTTGSTTHLAPPRYRPARAPALVGSDAGCGVSLVVFDRFKHAGDALERRVREATDGPLLPGIDAQAALTAVWREGPRGLASVDGVPEELAEWALAEAAARDDDAIARPPARIPRFLHDPDDVDARDQLRLPDDAGPPGERERVLVVERGVLREDADLALADLRGLRLDELDVVRTPADALAHPDRSHARDATSRILRRPPSRRLHATF